MFTMLYKPFNRRDQSTKSSTFPIIAAMICLGMIAVVIAVTIVLALIPIYLHTTTATSNTNGYQSKENSLIVRLNENESSSGRRRRDLSEFCANITGGEIRGINIENIRQFFIQSLPTTYAKCRNLVLSKATIESDLYNRRRKRSIPISRRASSPCALVLIVKYYIHYKTTCLSACRKTLNGQLYSEIIKYRQLWKNQKLDNVSIYKGDTLIGTFSIYLDEFFWASDLNSDETLTAQSATTVASATADLSG